MASALCARCGINERRTSHSYCAACGREYQQWWAMNNKESRSAASKRAALKRMVTDPDKERNRQRLVANKYRAAHRERYLATVREWRRKNPDKVREAKARYRAKNRASIRAYDAQRRRCNSEWRAPVRRWEERNPDLVRQAKLVREARRRARKKGVMVGTVTRILIEQRFSMFGWRCWVCGGVSDSIDHVKPLARGGAHILANLRPVCGPCNARKADRWPYGKAVRL